MRSMRIKYYIKTAVHGSRILTPWPAVPQSSLSIFTYHSFCIDAHVGPCFPSLPITIFERQIRMLKQHYRLVGLSEGIHGLDSAGEGRPMATITLDDGFADNYECAYPVLLRNRVPATIFLATDFVNERRAPWPTRLWDIVNAIAISHSSRSRFDAGALYRSYNEALRVLPAESRFEELDRLIASRRLTGLPDRQALSWDQIREMNAAGIVFGSHTAYHGLLPFLDESEVTLELAESKRLIEEKLQAPCDFFAYPNGDHSPQVSALIKCLGYQAALTQDFGANTNGMDAYCMKRIEVPYHDPLPSFAYRARRALKDVSKNSNSRS